MNMQEEILKNLDVEYSRDLAKRMEAFASNSALGFRTAGSRAEFETGEMLRKEMEENGLQKVEKDAVRVDGWEFRRAELAFCDAQGAERTIQLGAYQTQMVTRGFEEFSLMDLGKGTEGDYAGKDVRGKLVLVEINQRDEWWINYPAYQAWRKGARALIAVQSGGYGEIGDEALNAQDIAGPENAPAFSISRKDARSLRALLRGKEEIRVRLNADSRVWRDGITYNVHGAIPGRHEERMVLLCAHYDSYFSGFQDDNTAVGMMLGIARALLKSGFRPNNTLVFCAMAAEEWGVADSSFDWSTGCYEQVFTVHPEWAGKTVAALNFELPALAHGTRARIRCCYEYMPYLREFLAQLPELTRAYPEQTQVTAPIETWSDDFSLAISGIPSMVNDFTGGSFMETNYHSQFDSDAFYDEKVYRLHHELFALLVEALDRTAVVPLSSEWTLRRAAKCLQEIPHLEREGLREKAEALREILEKAALCAREEYARIADVNGRYAACLLEGKGAQAEEIYRRFRPWERNLLERFKRLQDALVRVDWYGNVLCPQEIILKNLRLLRGSLRDLQKGDVDKALKKLYQVDNNAYAFMFEEEVFRHFTDYAFRQPRERLKWGYGRLMQHADLYGSVRSLMRKKALGETDFCGEIAYLEAVAQAQEALLEQEIDALRETVEKRMEKKEGESAERRNPKNGN